MSTEFKPYGWVRSEKEHEIWKNVEIALKRSPYAMHEPTGALVQVVRPGTAKPALWCRDFHTGEESLLSGILLKPLTEMEVVAHAAS
jgi:hypothetical protein